MSSIARAKRLEIRVRPWLLAALEALEEHHLCATSDDRVPRSRFTDDLVAQLSLMDGTQVCVINGEHVRDAASFGSEIELALGVDHGRHPVQTVDGIIWALRRRFAPADQPPIKRRFIVWTDAHELLRRDARLFGQIADAMMGVAAESEFASEDLLLLQRCVFIGRTALDVYAEDSAGQFRAWLREGDEEPLWSIVSGQQAPRVKRARIGNDGGATLVEPGTPGLVTPR